MLDGIIRERILHLNIDIFAACCYSQYLSSFYCLLPSITICYYLLLSLSKTDVASIPCYCRYILLAEGLSASIYY